MNPLILATATADAGTTVSWSTVLGPGLGLLSVIAAAWFGARWKSRADQQVELRQHSLNRYYDSIALVLSMREAFEAFTSNAPHGSRDRKADKAAREAIDYVGEAFPQMRDLSVWLKLLSSSQVVEAYDRFGDRMWDYLNEVVEQQETDGVFRGAAAEKFHEDFETLLDEYVHTLRVDLRLERKRPRKRKKVTPPSYIGRGRAVLRSSGFTEQPDGSWHPPYRVPPPER